MNSDLAKDKTVDGTEDEACPESEDGQVDYDKILTAAGEFGVSQLLLFISTGPFYIVGAFAYFAQLFQTEVAPNHWCWIPELENLTTIERRNLAIPKDVEARFGYSQCKSYVANWSRVLSFGVTPDPSWMTESCQHGWEFNQTEIPYPTISSELGWVCDRGSYQATAQSIFFFGSIVGGFLVGWVADHYGRLPGAAFANLIGCVAGVATAFTQDFTQFAVCRFIMGMSYDNCMMMIYILLVEYVAPKYRAISANIPFALFFSTGLCILPWIALACAHWRVLALATSIPMGLALLAPFVMPESPRWLLSKGRIDAALDKINSIARLNRKVIPTELISQFKKNAVNQQDEKGNIIDLLRRPLLRILFILSCILYASLMIVFDALVRSVGTLKFDFFLSFTLVSLTELPSLVLTTFIIDWVGRKRLCFATLLIAGIFSIMATFVGVGMPSVICVIVARFVINMACNTSMQWAAEVLPTPVRASGISIVHICGYIGTTVSPFIVYLDIISDWLPMIVVGAISFLGSVISMGLPETAGKEMPQSFDEAEDLMRSVTLCALPCTNKESKNIGHVNNSFQMN